MTYIYVCVYIYILHMCVYIYILHMFAMQYRTDTLKPSFSPQEIMKKNYDSLI